MKTLIKNAQLVNEGHTFRADVLIENEIIIKIDKNGISAEADEIIDAEKYILIPGVIDDQVHFREPGLTHKADIYTESRAAVAGGVTSFMEMPNTNPPATTQELLEQKYQRASQVSLGNYSFFMGTSLDNYEEVMRTPLDNVCGVKIFMGSSTGNMLVDDEVLLERIFSNCQSLIATHCEDDQMVKHTLEKYRVIYGENIPAELHPIIRDKDACFNSSSLAFNIATKHGTRLHILHISTAKECGLFENDIPLKQKRITAEACVHHLWFTADDYKTLGNQIKCNPAIKEYNDRETIWQALLTDRIDIIATDHAPHTWQEKQNPYTSAPAGLPLVQHGVLMMLEEVKKARFTIEKMVEKMCHAPADCFGINNRGYIREGYYADLVLVDPTKTYTVSKENLLYKCGWSPLEGTTFSNSIAYTFVSGKKVYENGKIIEAGSGMRMMFDRN